MSVNEPPIGRAAVLFMLVVFVLLAAVSLARGGIPARPACLQDGSAEKCAVLAGSTDRSGFIVLTMRRDMLDGGIVLGGISFFKAWSAAPECKLRPADTDYPKVEIETTDEAFKIFASQDARYPRRMQWFYICAESK